MQTNVYKIQGSRARVKIQGVSFKRQDMEEIGRRYGRVE
jgi:hypothetical protein